MRRTIAGLLALLCAPAMAAPAAAPQPAPIGILETPARPIHRLTIVSAFSCPFCRILDTQGMAELRSTWARRGLQIETIPVSISPTDTPASIAATCGDARGYARRTTILFRAQPDILGNWAGADERAKQRATAQPKGAYALEIARLAGILSLAPSLGLTETQLRGCLADPVRQQRQVARERAVDARYSVRGTPTAFLDGRKVGSTWADIRAALSSAFGAS